MRHGIWLMGLVLAACASGDKSTGANTAPPPTTVEVDAPPVVDAGPDQIVDEQAAVTLSGLATDPDGSVASTTWTQTEGPTVTLNDPSAPSTGFTAPAVTAATLLVFELSATDDEGLGATSATSVVVQPVNAAPIADAGPDQSVDPDVLVQLAGVASDSDGSVASTTWTQLGGPAIALSDPTVLDATFTAPATGPVVLELTVVDDEGAEHRDSVAVEVLVDLPPVVDAGPTQVVDEATAVLLAGTASDDRTLVGTAWTQIAGPAVVLSDAAVLDPTFDAPAVTAATTVTLELEATDDRGQTATDRVDVLVQPVNLAPVVDAGADQAVLSDEAVVLLGSATDPDGAIAAIAWTQLSGPAVSLSGADTESPGFTSPTVATPASLVFQIAATDDEGAIAADVVEVTVDPLPNSPPTVDAGVDQIVPEQTLVLLSGTASDPDGTVASTVWTQLAGPVVALSDPGSLAPEFTAPTTSTPEWLLFELAATDDDGATSRALTEVLVEPTNQPPDVDAGPFQIVVENDPVQLQGAASDSDGVVVSTTWTQLSGPAVALDDPTRLDPSFTAPPTALDQDLVFELVAIDDEGAVRSDQTTVTVLPLVAVNQAPVVYAGPDQAVPDASLVLLDGTASDPDGSVVSTLWTQISGPPVTLTDPTALATDFTAPDVACAVTLVFELAATDDLGGVGTDSVAVTVDGDLTAAVPIPVHFDLDLDDGGLVSEGGVWSWGTITSGPQSGWSGTTGWATNPAGNYANNAQGWLCLPGLDRAGATDATLSMRLWVGGHSGDAAWIEVLNPAQGWVQLADVDPAYDVSSPAVGWRSQTELGGYRLATVALPNDIPDPIRLRVAFQSDGGFTSAGAYLDEIRVDLESSDPDGDGLLGVRDEWFAFGTDPFVADQDQDGFTDGAEILDGTDPDDPSDYTGQVVVGLPWSTDFEADDGDLIPTGSWEHGAPSAGLSMAYSGSNLWATDLDGNYGYDERSALYLPDVDLTAAVDPVLSFRIRSFIHSGDGVSVQIWDDVLGWTVLTPDQPAWTRTDAVGQSAWGTLGFNDHYELAILPLDLWAGQVVRLRITLNSDSGFISTGALIDDLGVHDEATDPDGDGLDGVFDELVLWGTDPFQADTDGDGDLDGDEVAAGTDPLNPADNSTTAALVVGSWLDFELSDGGLVGEEGFEWGTIASGPGVSWDGSNGWATNLDGNYGGDRRPVLYFPPVDLAGAADPTLSFRLWTSAGTGDAAHLEAYEPITATWVSLSPDVLPYTGTDGAGAPGWRATGYQSTYELTAFSLAPWVGSRVSLRVWMYSDASFSSTGLYLDELRIDEEAGDPDGDGIAGVIAESALGTDPYVADTDSDGVSDGAELADASGANPAVDPTVLAWLPGDRIDLELDDGGLATDGALWDWGVPSSGPLAGFTGARVWGSALAGNYFQGAQEYLYLPPIDLTGAVDPSLAWHAWVDLDSGDGYSVEIEDPIGGWMPLNSVVPAYDSTDGLGFAAWRVPWTAGTWGVAGAHLDPWIGQEVRLRIAFRANTTFVDPGVYLDDLAVDEEGLDHDGDGLIGLLDEREVYGTDPLVADTDGDGVDDGTEVGAGTDPLDPLSW